MALQRMLAIAESVWSTPENKNFADFKRRLAGNLPLLDRQNVNYRIPEPEGLQNVAVNPNLVQGRREGGYSEATIRKVLGGNLLRVWMAVDAAGAKLRGEVR